MSRPLKVRLILIFNSVLTYTQKALNVSIDGMMPGKKDFIFLYPCSPFLAYCSPPFWKGGFSFSMECLTITHHLISVYTWIHLIMQGWTLRLSMEWLCKAQIQGLCRTTCGLSWAKLTHNIHTVLVHVQFLGWPLKDLSVDCVYGPKSFLFWLSQNFGGRSVLNTAIETEY